MKVISAKDVTVRLFKSDCLEFLTKVHWSVPLLLYVPVVTYCLYGAVTHPLSTPWILGGMLLVGFVFWTLVEYLLHRFVFHFQPRKNWLKRAFYLIHEVHHEYPQDSLRLVMPPVESIPLAFLLYFGFSALVPAPYFYPFFAGFGIGYLSYDMVHYSVHHLPMKNRVAALLKQHHLRHHFQQEDRGYGVSSPWWDLVFKTSYAHDSGKGFKAPAVIIFLALGFLLSKFALGGVDAVHVLFAAGILLLYFLHVQSRRFLIIGIPILIYAMMYDFFRYIPFEWLTPVHVRDIFQWDLWLFGVKAGGVTVPLHEFLLQRLSHPAVDFFAGGVYFLHIPMVLLAALIFWKYRSAELAQRYTAAFLLMNIFAFSTYFLFPAAAPWYVERFGFLQPLHPIAGDAAGLVKFEQILGLKFVSDNYRISSVVFGAVPSMHAGFSTMAWLYAFQVNRKFAAILGVYVFSMAFSALYLQHHYFIDVVWGMFYAVAAWYCVEKLLWRGVGRGNAWLWKNFE